MHESRAPDSYKSGVVVHICKFQHLGSEGKRIRTSGSPWVTFKASLSYMKPCLKTHCLDSYLQTGNIEFHLQFGIKFTVNSGLLKPHCNTCACLNVWEQRHCLHNMWWLTWIISDSGFKISIEIPIWICQWGCFRKGLTEERTSLNVGTTIS